jgi:hypothetical protein
MMADIAGYKINVHVNPAFVRANEVVRLVGDNRRLMAATGPLAAVPLADTLRWMYHGVSHVRIEQGRWRACASACPPRPSKRR